MIVAGKPKAKNKDTGRAIHFRTGPERFNAGGVGEAPRGGKGSGKTTRTQRTNKVYKRYLTGRPTVDDVERASRGDRTKAMGVVEREAPYRLNRADREAWERAKRRGGHGHGDGTGGGGFLEIQTKQTNALAPHRHPLVNTHRLYCDAKQALFVLVEQDNEGRDEIVCDLSTLRLERDAECRARLVALAATMEPGIVVDDACGDEEPIESQARYVAAMERDRLDGLSGLSGSDPSTMTDPPSDSDSNGDASSPAAAAPSDETLATARDAVDALGEEIRALKDGGAQNSDSEVARRVANLLELKAELRALEDAAEASTPDAIEAAIRDEREARERAVEEARRSLAESPIYALPERYLRFKCPDRPTAKALAKALAQEDLLVLALEPA